MPKVALGQMAVQWNRREANLVRACNFVRAASRQGADIVVLPECLDLGWLSTKVALLAEPIPGAASSLLQEAARAAGVYVAAGLTERDGANFYNASVLIDPDGRLILHHRKIHELPEGRSLYKPGSAIQVVDTPWGVTGIPICADNFMEALAIGDAMGLMGARLILSPCAWAVEPRARCSQEEYLAFWMEPYRRLAQRHALSIVAVSNVGWVEGGPWSGYRCIGSSAAVGPDGSILGQAPYGVESEALVIVEVPERGCEYRGEAHASDSLGRAGERSGS